MKRKLMQFIWNTWGIDPDHAAVEWGTDLEEGNCVTWRFIYEGQRYRATYDKDTRAVTGALGWYGR